ncbi:M28 family metallopeptidase [Phanerochaete sordida]|uniref:Peptide hydrolase n=1 Tax=Phanerochaete sordida TaxID=48140 RepID=A0A9P3GCH2_9APHY|nr:M28 family metallopeptidase [Phanerochaete sordida]
MAPPTTRARWGPIRSLLFLAPVLIGAPWFAYRDHRALPEPTVDLVNPQTSLPQISEAQILAHAKYLSEDIGYRTVGTREHALGDAWMVARAEELKAQCDEIVKATPGRKLECEVWRQEGSGHHRFDIMAKRLYKTYVNLSNIVVRVSDGTKAGKEHAVLINSHLDSTLPSPGAADDALSVGVMLECIRVLINTPEWEPRHSIVFLFNNAEESLQDGSHLFSTQHPIADSVRAVINLEAAGTTGPELLFQATSEEMIQAYSQVPRPFGTIVASEIFSSGVMMSDTDFRQFELYLNVTGLDMAVVGNSYLYHMRKDLVENIEPGVAQHMGDNTLALLQYLASPESPLPSLTAGYSKPTTVYFQSFKHFFIYSFDTAKVLYAFVFGLSVSFSVITYSAPAPALKKSRGFISDHLRGLFAIGSAVVGAIAGANVVALVMAQVLKKPLSWFSVEVSCALLYGPAALTGALISQLFMPDIREKTVFTSLLLVQSALAWGIQAFGIGSAALFFISSLPLCLALLLNSVVSSGPDVSLLSYAIGQFIPLTTGAQLAFEVLNVFVPLTGRTGAEAPAEHIIATLVAVLSSYLFPLFVPFTRRYGRSFLTRSILIVSMVTAVAIAVFSARNPFDTMHQKRLFVIHMENITSQEQHLHVAAADSAPGFDALAHDIAERFGAPGVPPAPVVMTEWNADWDTIYPFSAFITPYKLELPLKEEYMDPLDFSFVVSAVNDHIDKEAGTRKLTLKVEHPSIIWTAVAFDAHVLSWDLDDNPPDEYARHHIKEASFYGHDTWTVDLLVKLVPEAPADGRIRIDFVGIHEKAMWPGKRAEKHLGGHAMQLFEELDGWLDDSTGGTVDATLLGCVGGVAWV